jgi:hypothetical protein
MKRKALLSLVAIATLGAAPFTYGQEQEVSPSVTEVIRSAFQTSSASPASSSGH